MHIRKIHENILVYDWGSIIELCLTGNSGDRDELRSSMITFAAERFAHFPKIRVFIQLLIEINKNIYDHAAGLGKLKFCIEETAIRFEIWNETEETLDVEKISQRGYSTAKAGSPNYGAGIGIICELGRSGYFSDFDMRAENRILKYSGKFLK